ncbi:hypothetical protein [Phenylobacterium hankyongense]|nr:hypothetical protein [Phenylobacterium hankyongense]
MPSRHTQRGGGVVVGLVVEPVVEEPVVEEPVVEEPAAPLPLMPELLAPDPPLIPGSLGLLVLEEAFLPLLDASEAERSEPMPMLLQATSDSPRRAADAAPAILVKVMTCVPVATACHRRVTNRRSRSRVPPPTIEAANN